MKILSVVVPMHNAELYIDDCLRSITEQGLDEDIEVLLIDDGSIDSTVTIAKKWMARYSYFQLYSQPASGVSAARNRGLALASGKYFAFLDADDILAPMVYPGLIRLLEKTGSDFVTSPVYRFSNAQRRAWEFTRNIDLFDVAKTGITFQDHPEFIRDFMLWNKVFRTSFLKGAGLSFPVGKIYEDIAVTPRLFHRAKRFDVVTSPTVFWRMNPGSITHTLRPEKALDRLEILKDLRDFFRSIPMSEKALDEVDFAIVDYNLRWILQEFARYDFTTQSEILARTRALSIEISDDVFRRAPEPLSRWMFLLKAGRLAELTALLRENPEVPNVRVGEHPERRARASVRKSKRKARLQFFMFTWRRRFRHVFIYLLYRPIIWSLPLDKKGALFSNYWGTKFSHSDGPAAIAVELSKQRPDFKLIVVAAKHKYDEISNSVSEMMDAEAKVKVVRNHSLRFFYHLWRAKYLFNDVNFSIGFNVDRFVEKRPGQLEVQTTHGTPLKKMGIDSDVAISAEEMPKFLAKNKRYDFLVAPSPLVGQIFASSHGVNPRILPTGLPQNDRLFEEVSEAQVRDIKIKYGLNPKKRLLVYAPTYRHGRGFAFRYAMDLRALHREFGDEFQIAIKIHPFSHTNLAMIDFRDLTEYCNQNDAMPFVRLFGSIHDHIPHRPVHMGEVADAEHVRFDVPADINELMLAADTLITDFSSIIFSYPHLKKPLILFAPDAQAYEEQRGMYFNIRDIAPGAFTTTNDELITAIKASTSSEHWTELYGERESRFKEMFHLWERGDSSEKILRALGIVDQQGSGTRAIVNEASATSAQR